MRLGLIFFLFLLSILHTSAFSQNTLTSHDNTENQVGLKIGAILSYGSNFEYHHQWGLGIYKDIQLSDKVFANFSLLYSKSFFKLDKFDLKDYTSHDLSFDVSLNSYLGPRRSFYAIAGLSLQQNLNTSTSNNGNYQNGVFRIMTGLGYDVSLGNKQQLKIEGIARYGRKLGLSPGVRIRYGF